MQGKRLLTKSLQNLKRLSFFISLRNCEGCEQIAATVGLSCDLNDFQVLLKRVSCELRTIDKMLDFVIPQISLVQQELEALHLARAFASSLPGWPLCPLIQ